MFADDPHLLLEAVLLGDRRRNPAIWQRGGDAPAAINNPTFANCNVAEQAFAAFVTQHDFTLGQAHKAALRQPRQLRLLPRQMVDPGMLGL